MIAPEKHLECETMPDAFSGPGDPSSGLLRRYLRRTMIVVPVLALVALLSGPASGLLRRARVLPAADRFTAMSFSDPATLPATYAPGVPMGFGFQILDLEGHVVTYRWIAEDATEGPAKALGRGSLTVAPGRPAAVRVTATLTGPGPAMVRIRLVGRTEELQFRVLPRSGP
jgi:hypothetical protein